MTLLPDFDTLPLRRQIAQMMVVRASGHLFDHQIQYPKWEPPAATLQSWLSEYGVGGVILLGGSAAEVALRIKTLQHWATVPLLVAADLEEGVGQRFAGGTCFPPPMALAALPTEMGITYAEAIGRITAAEAQAIGVNWVLAPIVDVNNNRDNPVINVRAFGETPQVVADLSCAFIRGAQQHRVLTTAKHFPGHGDTAVDSHLHTPILPHDRDRFEQIEFPPFRAAIEAGVDAVMSAHVLAPALDAHHVATLSPAVLQQLLRQNLGFSGLIVTDALVMAGIADRMAPEDVAVQAIQAGADILLMPIDPVATISAIERAVEQGAIGRDRLWASLERIWQAKTRVCRSENQFPDLSGLAQAESLSTAGQITTKSLQVHLPTPIAWDAGFANVLLVDDLLTCREFLPAGAPAANLPGKRLLVDRHTLPVRNFADSDRLFLQIFSRGNPFRGSADLHDQIAHLINSWAATDKLLAIVLYGSPFSRDRLISLLPDRIPWGFSYSQYPDAQAALLATLGAKPWPAQPVG